MTPTDLETLRGLVKILREYEGRIACGNAAWDADDWNNYNKFQYEADQLLHLFTREGAKSLPALTALLAERDALREALTACVAYMKDDSGGYEIYKATLEHAQYILNIETMENTK